MYEYDVILSDGRHAILFGYSMQDALRRYKMTWADIKEVIGSEYID